MSVNLANAIPADVSAATTAWSWPDVDGRTIVLISVTFGRSTTGAQRKRTLAKIRRSYPDALITELPSPFEGS